MNSAFASAAATQSGRLRCAPHSANAFIIRPFHPVSTLSSSPGWTRFERTSYKRSAASLSFS